LRTLNESPAREINKTELTESLTGLKTECEIDIAHKVMAGKHGAYQLLLDLLEKNQDEPSVCQLVLGSLTTLMTGQPDLLTERGVQAILSSIKV
jgi:armadillo repeat-containing protein 6